MWPVVVTVGVVTGACAREEALSRPITTSCTTTGRAFVAGRLTNLPWKRLDALEVAARKRSLLPQ